VSADRARDRNPEPSRGASSVAGPRRLGTLSDLAELLGGDTARSRRFLGGFVVGALVGAALAGGTLLRRRERRPPSGS
jgi:hypothetical protein